MRPHLTLVSDLHQAVQGAAVLSDSSLLTTFNNLSTVTTAASCPHDPHITAMVPGLSWDQEWVMRVV